MLAVEGSLSSKVKPKREADIKKLSEKSHDSPVPRQKLQIRQLMVKASLYISKNASKKIHNKHDSHEVMETFRVVKNYCIAKFFLHYAW